MAIEIRRQFFKDRKEVLGDLKATGFWPTTFVSGPSPGLEVHWHSHDVHAYVVEGHTSFLDGSSGERHAVGPGDKIVVPARSLHAEGEVTDRVVYIIAAPEALPPDEFLKLHDPNDL
jgi:mannose-6-phosphate isomerase-like protein (cupin superfamily)